MIVTLPKSDSFKQFVSNSQQYVSSSIASVYSGVKLITLLRLMKLELLYPCYSSHVSSWRVVPRVKTNIETSGFSVASPTLWNSLPVSARSVGNNVMLRSTEDLSPFLGSPVYSPIC